MRRGAAPSQLRLSRAATALIVLTPRLLGSASVRNDQAAITPHPVRGSPSHRATSHTAPASADVPAEREPSGARGRPPADAPGRAHAPPGLGGYARSPNSPGPAPPAGHRGRFW